MAAKAWALMDLRSGEYLAVEKASKELATASTTKIMAALVVLEKADLDEEVPVSKNAAAYATPAYSNVGLLPGDTLSVKRKTGTTPAAGESLVSSASTGDESYVCVVLDSTEERFAASVRALRYGFAANDRKDLVVGGKRYASIEVPYRREQSVDLVAQRSVDGLVDANPDVERDVDLEEDLPPSAKAGTRLGEVVVKVDGKKVGETRLIAKKGYEEASLGQRVWYTVEGIFQ